MSSIKVSALTAKTTPAGTEELLINDSGVSKKITIANLPDTDTVYTHPTGAGNLHVPTGGTVNQLLTNTASGTGTWQDAPVSLPSQATHAGKYLTTDATTASWATLNTDPTMGGDLSGTASNAQIVANAVTDTELNSAKLNGIETGATANGTVTGSGTTSGTNTGDNTVCTSGTATTAATLATARTIAGVSFDGSANISLNNNAITNGAGYITSYTNTTYSAGTGLDLAGTTFSIEPDLRDGITHVGRDTNDYIEIGTDRIRFYINGVHVMSCDSSGNIIAKGSVTAFGTPI